MARMRCMASDAICDALRSFILRIISSLRRRTSAFSRCCCSYLRRAASCGSRSGFGDGWRGGREAGAGAVGALKGGKARGMFACRAEGGGGVYSADAFVVAGGGAVAGAAEALSGGEEYEGSSGTVEDARPACFWLASSSF